MTGKALKELWTNLEWEEQLKNDQEKLQKKGSHSRLLVSVSVSLALREANDTSWMARFGWFCIKSGLSSHPAELAPRQNAAGAGPNTCFYVLRAH